MIDPENLRYSTASEAKRDRRTDYELISNQSSISIISICQDRPLPTPKHNILIKILICQLR